MRRRNCRVVIALSLRTLVASVPLLALISSTAVSAESMTPPVAIDNEGTVHVLNYTIPFSAFASEVAKKTFIEEWVSGVSISGEKEEVSTPEGLTKYVLQMRRIVDDAEKAFAERMGKTFTVNISTERIGGIGADVVVPANGSASRNRERVLIALHGGGMVWGAGYEGKLLSIPVASIGRIRVISVDYRMAPEYRFPAASEDVATVYRMLLKRYRPENIGIIGDSSGGALAAQAIAWFQFQGLPRPGALVLLASSLGRLSEGDSHYLPTGAWFRDERLMKAIELYGSQAPPDDPRASPLSSVSALSKFPPTAFLTGSRDVVMSSAIYSHIQLVKAGVVAELYMWDGLEHGFTGDSRLPEFREAYDVVVKFFDSHLGTAARKQIRTSTPLHR